MASDGPLQFDQAEFENPAHSQCAECQRPLSGAYYDVNGLTMCEACRYQVEARLNAGSGAVRFIRAAGGGLAAAIGGAVLYYAISALTGYEFGLIAIVVGFAVGTAVRWGSNGRGGWKYQALAMALTYFAIVSTYIPPIIEGFRSGAAAEASAAAAEPGDAANPTGAAGATPDAAPAEDVPAVVAIMVVLVIAAIAPFLAGFENIIGLIIIGIGLYEAWKLNRRTELTITGPHVLAPAPAAPVAATASGV